MNRFIWTKTRMAKKRYLATVSVLAILLIYSLSDRSGANSMSGEWIKLASSENPDKLFHDNLGGKPVAIYTYGEFGKSMARLHHLGAIEDDQPDEDWKFWNKKPETHAMIREYGEDNSTMLAFMDLYEKKGWGKGSGSGSAVQRAAKSITLLSKLLPALGVTLLIDFPCGDQQWAPHLRQALPGVKYLGADIMPGLIQRNQETYGSRITEFVLMGLDKLEAFRMLRDKSKLWNYKDVVAVMTRHALEHNTFETSCAYLASLHQSGATYFIGTNAFDVKLDLLDPKTAGYIPINFYSKPFLFPRGIVSWHETSPLSDIFPEPGTTMMEIWDIGTLPKTCTYV
jgi:hypothetical protein